MIGLVTDSNTMVPAALRERHHIHSVPLSIVIDGQPFLEDALDPATFFRALRRGLAVSTAAPSPGAFLDTYQLLRSRGATAIVSVHVGSALSGTMNAVRVAVAEAGVPVHAVDTGSASFAAGLAVLAAATALHGTTDPSVAVTSAERVAQTVASVFTVSEIARARRGGRIDVASTVGVPVVTMRGAEVAEITRADTVVAAADAMAAHLGAQKGLLRVGVGAADDADAAACLRGRVRALPNVVEILDYEVGPSVAAHTGAGTFGAVFHTVDAQDA